MRMREKLNEKRVVAVVLAAGLCLLTVAGCSGAETQDEVVVAKEQDGEQVYGQTVTGDEAEENAMEGNVAEQVQAPEVYQAEVSSDKVRVKVDAAIIMPDVPGIKLKKVTGRVLTQKDCDAVSKALFGAEKLSYIDFVALSETQDNRLGANVTVNGQDYYVVLENTMTNKRNYVSFEIDKQDGDGDYLFFSDSHPDLSDIHNVKIRQGVENMKTPPEEIQAKAQEAVNQMGLSEYVMQGGEYFICWGAEELDVGYQPYVDNIGYGVHFARVVDGVPVSYTHAYGDGNDGTGPYTSWRFEELTFIYNDEGLRSFEWVNPYEVEDLSAEYVFLLPFSDISNIFEEMILKKYADCFNNEGDTVDIKVDKAVLSYMRVREKGSVEGTLIPVWDFLGVKTFKTASGEVDLVRDSVYDSMITINAMDGTVVSRDLGY